MSAAGRFLRVLANVLATAQLYDAEHPAVGQVLGTAHAALDEMFREAGEHVFSFVDDEVIHGEQPLEGLRTWSWSGRLFAAGVQRIEFSRGATREELGGFLAEISRRLELGEAVFADAPHPHIRMGALGIRKSDPERFARASTNASAMIMAEEAEAVQWMHESAEAKGVVPTDEATAVVRALLVAMHHGEAVYAPLLTIKQADQYTTTHCINVSILSMSLAEQLRLPDCEVRRIGEAALVHDIGKTKVPLEILNKPGKLTDEEFAIVKTHTTEGARMLIANDWNPLATVIALEHHMHWRGGGYPERRHPRPPHHHSRLVQVCDVYDAVRTRRPYRPSLSHEAALGILEKGSGSEFDPLMVGTFGTMMRTVSPKTIAARDAEDVADPPASPDASSETGLQEDAETAA